MVFVLLLNRLSAGLASLQTVCSAAKQVAFATSYAQPRDDGLKMSPKHLEAWQRNKEEK
jgi:hypothetical protein